MKYPVLIEKDGDGYLAKFPDIPEALTGGDTRDHTLELAEDALHTAFEFYFEDNREVPAPSKVEGAEYIDVPLSLAAKVVLLNELIRSGYSRAELARRMGTKPQEVNRIVDLGHTTKIDTIDKALQALGKRLELTVV